MFISERVDEALYNAGRKIALAGENIADAAYNISGAAKEISRTFGKINSYERIETLIRSWDDAGTAKKDAAKAEEKYYNKLTDNLTKI